MLKPSLALLLFVTACNSASPQVDPQLKSPLETPKPELHYKTVVYPQAKLHVVTVPAGAGIVEVGVADRLQPISAFDDNSFAILNAGFFDPNNQKSTSHATVNGTVVADPRVNEGLTQNPRLKPYLPAIFDRSEFRRYDCQGTVRYGIVRHSAPIEPNCQLVDAIGGGPQLLSTVTAQAEAFFDPTTGRDPIGIDQNNARSAIGLTAKGDVLLVMAEASPGVSLPQLASWLKKLGATQALNLDGGSSSSLYYKSQTLIGKTTDQKTPAARSIKSVLRVRMPL